MLRYTTHYDTFLPKIRISARMNKKQIVLVDLELKKMLRQETIKRTQSIQGEFLSNLLCGKGGYRPVINLKMFN